LSPAIPEVRRAGVDALTLLLTSAPDRGQADCLSLHQQRPSRSEDSTLRCRACGTRPLGQRCSVLGSTLVASLTCR
jgi:hypothetical protein